MKHFLSILSIFAFYLSANASDTLITGSLNGNHVWNTSMADTFTISGNVVMGNQLIIEEGVVVNLEGDFNLQGYLKANGTSANRIVFLGDSLTGWSLRLNRNPDTLLYCDFVDVQSMQIAQLSSDLDHYYFNHCKWERSGQFIVGRTTGSYPEVLIENSEFFQNQETVNLNRIVFKLMDCEIHEGEAFGFRPVGTVLQVSDCDIHHNNGNSFYMFDAVNRSDYGRSYIENSRFHHNKSTVIRTQFNANIDLDFINNECDSNDAVVLHIVIDIEGAISRNQFHHNTTTAVSINNGWVREFNGNYFYNNSSSYSDGALYLRASDNMYLHSNVFANNFAFGGAALYQQAMSSVSEIYHFNSVFVNNKDSLSSANNGAAVYTTNSRVHHFVNCIFRGNEDINGGVANFGGFSTGRWVSYSNVEGGHVGNNNIDNNPQFLNPSAGAGLGFDASNSDWSITACNSSALNSGNTDSLYLKIPNALYDAAGNSRVAGGIVDMGAFEMDGTSDQTAWTNQPVCSYQSSFDLEAAFPKNGIPSASSWQVDTGNGVWFNIIAGIIPGISFNNDTLVASGVPIVAGNYNYRVINSYSCLTDTSISWSPELIARTFQNDTLGICEKDSVFLEGAWQNMPGTYIDSLTNWKGCDSILTTVLFVVDEPVVDVYDTICPGGQVTWNGNVYSRAGEYEFRSFIGGQLFCDSVTVLHLAEYTNFLGSSTDTTVGCIGDTITFNVGNPNILTYSWSDGTNTGGDSTFSIVPSNFWERTFVTITDVNGCTVLGTRDFLKFEFDPFATQIDVNQLPSVTFDLAVGPPNNADLYYWSFGDGDTSSALPVTHTYQNNNVFEWCFIAVGLCGADSTCQDITISNVGLTERAESDYNIYPNPTEGTIRISHPGNQEIVFMLKDLNGKVLGQKRINSGEEFSLEQLPSGVYILELNSEGSTERRRLIKR